MRLASSQAVQRSARSSWDDAEQRIPRVTVRVIFYCDSVTSICLSSQRPIPLFGSSSSGCSSAASGKRRTTLHAARLVIVCGAGLSMTPLSNIPSARAVAEKSFDDYQLVIDPYCDSGLRGDIEAFAEYFITPATQNCQRRNQTRAELFSRPSKRLRTFLALSFPGVLIAPRARDDKSSHVPDSLETQSSSPPSRTARPSGVLHGGDSGR